MKRIIKSVFVLLLTGLVSVTIFAQTQNKQDISVLYVGFNPEKEMPAELPKGWLDERFNEEYKTRMPSFVEYLDKYFSKVGSIDAREYTAEISNKYDVTIFDESVKPIKERVVHTDPETGKFLSMERAIYLPEDYDRPSIFIGHTADVLGRSLGSKLDWYCLCLDRHAHHTKTGHEIFKGPFNVDLKLTNRPTPKPIFKHPDGINMPAEIPMWEVNTEGYLDGKGYRVGLVSRGWGFEDSPDAEVISSGVCDKAKTAVAIGRHGNFFLWGFSGSPDYMTRTAKQVFANAIVYTHKNADERIIAHKYNDRIATKAYIDDMLYYTTKDAYQHTVEFYKKMIAKNEARLKELKAKKEGGEELNEEEKMFISMPAQKIPTRMEFLKKNIGRNSWSKITGLDTLVIRQYLEENRDYFYSLPNAFYDIRVDEDCKSLGIANTNIKILDAAINLLEKGKDVEKAQRLLWRYTLEDFATAKEWRIWFNKYKSTMFFTQAGGYVWMINDANANPKIRPRADKKIEEKKAFNEASSKLKLDEPTHAEPVSIGATLLEGNNNDEKEVLIKTKIMDGYHIYAFVPKGEAYIKTEQGMEIPSGVQLVGEWKKTAPSSYPGKEGILIYKGESEFKQAIKLGKNLPAGSVVKCWLYYQCCDANICFPPKKKEFILEL